MSTMRNPNAKHIDFGAFKGLLWQENILPSDIDMIMERHNYFFIAEWKNDNEELSRGQELLLQSLAKEKNKFVFLVYGNTENNITTVTKFYRIFGDGTYKLRGTSLEELKELYMRWGKWANSQV